MSDLRERVARALCADAYKHIPTLNIDEQVTDPHWLSQADAAIALVRAETLEEAARCADRNAAEAWQEGAEETRGLMRLQAADIAAAIRALKEKTNG